MSKSASKLLGIEGHFSQLHFTHLLSPSFTSSHSCSLSQLLIALTLCHLYRYFLSSSSGISQLPVALYAYLKSVNFASGASTLSSMYTLFLLRLVDDATRLLHLPHSLTGCHYWFSEFREVLIPSSLLMSIALYCSDSRCILAISTKRNTSTVLRVT